MRPISGKNNKKTYLVNVALALVFYLLYYWRNSNIFLALSLIFLFMALYRRFFLEKIL
jgi:hypothetical protein